MATTKADWKLPKPPQCDACADEDSVWPAVHNTGDGWVWGWECEHCGPDDQWWDDQGKPNDPAAYSWPFVEDYAKGRDWERVGITTT